MVYPGLVLALAFGVIILLLNFTLPPLLELYTEFDAQLPWPTRFLMAVYRGFPPESFIPAAGFCSY